MSLCSIRVTNRDPGANGSRGTFCTSLCSIRAFSLDHAVNRRRVVLLLNMRFRHNCEHLAEKWQSCQCLDPMTGFSGEMERFNRPALDLITPGGVGQPELV